tara:strand:+ start:490 stop:759 length:270 start_codon:yes stop_codon:yes gene_type:complete
MDNIIDDIIFGLDEESQDFVSDSPVTTALLSHICLELESMNKTVNNWSLLTDIVLASAAFTFYKSGGNSEEFLQKIRTIDISPDISKLN